MIAVFVLNCVTSPYTYYQNYKHDTGNISTGVQLPPTYNANPPLPADAGIIAEPASTAPVESAPISTEAAPSTQPANP